jgi:hypothetical protein
LTPRKAAGQKIVPTAGGASKRPRRQASPASLAYADALLSVFETVMEKKRQSVLAESFGHLSARGRGDR